MYYSAGIQRSNAVMRMHPVGITLLTASLFTVQGSSGSLLSLGYDVRDEALTLRCPEDLPADTRVASVLLRQVLDDGAGPELAVWSSRSGVGEHCNRISVPQKPQKGKGHLEVIMNHVTCLDATQYECVVTAVDSKMEMVRKNDFQQFNFTGIATKPLIRHKPSKTCYRENDSITLDCSASIGEKENTFVWELGSQGGEFTPIVDNGGEIESKSDETPGPCSQQQVSRLRYRLKKDDDGKTFRCRLIQTNDTDEIIVAVTSCANYETESSAATTPTTVNVPITRTANAIRAITNETLPYAVKNVETGSLAIDPTVMLVATVACSGMMVVLVVVVLALVLRRIRAREAQFASAVESFATFSAYRMYQSIDELPPPPVCRFTRPLPPLLENPPPPTPASSTDDSNSVIDPVYLTTGQDLVQSQPLIQHEGRSSLANQVPESSGDMEVRFMSEISGSES